MSEALDKWQALIAKFHQDADRLYEEQRGTSEAAMAADKIKVNKAQEFIRNTKLDSAIRTILRETWHYGAWSKRPDFSNYSKLPVTDVSGAEVRKESGDEHRETRFTFNGRQYRFLFTKHRNYGPDGNLNFADIEVFCGEDLVLGFALTQDITSRTDYHEWRTGGLTALQMGPWLGDLSEMHRMIESTQSKGINDTLDKITRERAARIKLD